MLIAVDWSFLADTRDELWRDSFCLYAYLHPTRDWLLYVGKADFGTVRSRLRGDHKAALFRDIRREYGVDDVRVGIDERRWSAVLFVNNVADKRAILNNITQAAVNLADYNRVAVNQPRTAGIDLNYRFGGN